jgi:hypothetical protein
MDKIFNFAKRINNDTFLKDLPKGSIRNEILSCLLESYTFRVKHNISQEGYAKRKGLSLIAVKRIESGQCYNLILISKYTK